jgi:hypothetical protein
MNCYVKDFGRAKLAICEEELPNGMLLTVTERTEEPTADLWARLGALIRQTHDVVAEAQ